jgi:iron complex transport system ATP-binding protein
MVKHSEIVFEFRHADLGYGNHRVLSDVNLKVEAGSVSCLIGPNGVGKTTLFRSALGFLPPIKGEILVNGMPSTRLKPKDFARMVAYVPQIHNTPFPYKVMDVVLFGRAAHLGYFNTPDKKDHVIANGILDLLEIRHLAERPFSDLSGGEKQMVVVARALTQQTPFLIFDEPTSNLDYGNQWRILRKIRNLKNQSVGILMATHSPDHAFTIGSQVIILDQGSLFRQGTPDETLTPDTLKETYGVDVQIICTPAGDSPSRKICVPVMD